MQISSQPSPVTRACNGPVRPADLVYNLRLNNASSDGFYADLEHFLEAVLAEIEFRAATVIDRYSRHVQTELLESPRSRGEYAIDLLMLGMALRQYAGAAESTPGWTVELLNGLLRLRRASAPIKGTADFLRAIVFRVFLVGKIQREGTSKPTIGGLEALVSWLRATGEFEQEVARLDNWRSFLATLSEAESQRWMQISTELFDWFQSQAAATLGSYTRGVPRFLGGEYRRHRWCEDQIFCGRKPVEYHLNMVAAGVMNRGLRQDFAQTARRVVLIPGCMRGERTRTCRARVKDTDITCAACDRTCPVNHINRRMRSQGVEVFLVPHATGFSRWLQRWQQEPDCGVTAVACLLNILPGGYEMRARGVASQCVPLDYPGCKKHWHREGIATALNEERLVRTVAGSGP